MNEGHSADLDSFPAVILDDTDCPPVIEARAAMVPSMYAAKDRRAFESRVTAGVRRALVEYEDGKHVEHEAVARAAGTVIAFLDGMGS